MKNLSLSRMNGLNYTVGDFIHLYILRISIFTLLYALFICYVLMTDHSALSNSPTLRFEKALDKTNLLYHY